MEKIIKISLIITLTTLFNLSYAEYKVLIGKGNDNIKFVQWEDTTSIEGEWVNKSAPYGCTKWTPTVDEKDEGVSFTQTANDCKQDQERQVKLRSKDKVSGVIIVKDTIIEKRVNTDQSSTQSAIGIRPLIDCRFVTVSLSSGSVRGNYYVLKTGGTTTAYWNGNRMGTINYKNQNHKFESDGYNYYGTQLMFTDAYFFYTICKEKI